MNPLIAKNMRLVLAAFMIGGALVAGCAKRPVVIPATAPAPPAEIPPTPTPTPPPVPPMETPPGPSGVTSENLKPAFFDYDSYTLRDDAREVLDRNGKLLRDNPKVTITIEGHCDERGTVEYNQALSEKRAQGARDYLAAAGIDISRIEIIPYGKERPFAAGSDETSWQQNRRAHFVVRTSP